MTAFTFSLEQIKAAPPGVRRWIANEIAHALGSVAGTRPDEPRQPEPATLAACTPAQAMQVFELIADDVVAARVYFELARESTSNAGLPGLHALRMADLLHHVGLTNPDALIDGLGAIDRAFRKIDGGQSGGLFAFDEAGHVYLHEATQTSIRRVWEELVQARTAAEREPLVEAVPRAENFTPPHRGPSEDVGTHSPRSRPDYGQPF